MFVNVQQRWSQLDCATLSARLRWQMRESLPAGATNDPARSNKRTRVRSARNALLRFCRRLAQRHPKRLPCATLNPSRKEFVTRILWHYPASLDKERAKGVHQALSLFPCDGTTARDQGSQAAHGVLSNTPTSRLVPGFHDYRTLPATRPQPRRNPGEPCRKTNPPLSSVCAFVIVKQTALC